MFDFRTFYIQYLMENTVLSFVTQFKYYDFSGSSSTLNKAD